ncbi:hypothetical protein E9232_006360 [Inquilinus ginsengisoli]|uniref:Conjugal transfer protein TrbL n=1 Tax=Inquilinus ginsengisoli TaxID=363840 RepID=A0ABU1JYU8_9PROT|nr:hypothetical protein [Inquilinus ginsengisoli]MDR6293807.1 hypothetical protein [Inquilinus ginsengisoli]
MPHLSARTITSCIAGAVAGVAALAAARISWAAEGDTTGNFESIGAWTATINRFRNDITGKIDQITQFGSSYYSIAMVFMVGLAAIYLVIALTKYQFQGKNWAELIGSFVYAAIVMAIFVTYSVTVQAISEAPYGIVKMLQLAVLGSDDAFAPMVYLFKVATNITFNGDTAWYDLVGHIENSLTFALFAVVFLLVQATYLLAVAWATLWPIFYFFALKVLGFITVPFLFAGQLDFIFYGWLRQFFMLVLFVLIVNAVMMANVVLVAFCFNLPFSATFVGQTVVSGLLATTLIITVLVFGVVAIFQSQRIAAAWSGSDALSSGFARVAAQLITKGILR